MNTLERWGAYLTSSEGFMTQLMLYGLGLVGVLGILFFLFFRIEFGVWTTQQLEKKE